MTVTVCYVKACRCRYSITVGCYTAVAKTTAASGGVSPDFLLCSLKFVEVCEGTGSRGHGEQGRECFCVPFGSCAVVKWGYSLASLFFHFHASDRRGCCFFFRMKGRRYKIAAHCCFAVLYQ